MPGALVRLCRIELVLAPRALAVSCAVQVAGLLGHDAWRAREGLVGAWAAIWVEAAPPRVNRLKLH